MNKQEKTSRDMGRFVLACVFLLGAIALGERGRGAPNAESRVGDPQDGLVTQGRDALATRAAFFYLPEDPDYTILDSMKDSVRFTVERTLVEYKGHLSSKSSFVDKDGNIMALARLRQSRRSRLGGERRRRGL